jgi:dCTP deaminase
MLCDHEILSLCKNTDIVTPFDTEMIGPCSLDIHLGDRIAVYKCKNNTDIIDLHNRTTFKTEKYTISSDGIIILPHTFILANTIEYFKLPDDIVCQLTGRSSIGRLGLTVHVTAGLFDCGYEGCPTLEIANLNNKPIRIYPGDKIAQVTFEKITKCAKNYGKKGGRYQFDTDVNGSLY